MARFMLEEDSYFDQAFRCDECLYCCSTQLQYDAHLSTEQHWLICELLSALPHYSKPSTSDLRGGYQAYFFGNINFEIEVAQQGPYMYQHFGEVSGPRRPTGSEPRPALIWAPIIAIWLFQAPVLRRGVARSRLGAEVPKLHQNVGTCMGLVGQLLSQN